MISKTNIPKQNSRKVLMTALGAWVMTLATLIGSLQVLRTGRAIAVVNNNQPAYVYNNPGFGIWNRNDSKNETVRLPAKFDTGIHMTAVPGHK